MMTNETTSITRISMIRDEFRNAGAAGLTIADIERMFDITYAMAYKHVQSLVRQGFVRRAFFKREVQARGTTRVLQVWTICHADPAETAETTTTATTATTAATSPAIDIREDVVTLLRLFSRSLRLKSFSRSLTDDEIDAVGRVQEALNVTEDELS